MDGPPGKGARRQDCARRPEPSPCPCPCPCPWRGAPEGGVRRMTARRAARFFVREKGRGRAHGRNASAQPTRHGRMPAIRASRPLDAAHRETLPPAGRRHAPPAADMAPRSHGLGNARPPRIVIRCAGTPPSDQEACARAETGTRWCGATGFFAKQRVAKQRKEASMSGSLFEYGAVDVNRTHDLLITNQLLYRLSYNGNPTGKKALSMHGLVQGFFRIWSG